MRVRAIARNEVGLFAGLSRDAERTEAVLIELWEECRSCPEWRFVGVVDGRQIARIGFWVLPSIVTTFHVGWLTLPWEQDYLTLGTEFWSEVVARIHPYGATNIESALDSDADHLDERRRFYEHIGLPLIQEKWEYVWRNDSSLPLLEGRVQFKSLAEVGEEAFLEAIRRVIQGTLDREDQYDLRIVNLEEAARRYFGLLKDIDYTPERWLLAYHETVVPHASPQTTLIGLVAPQMFNDEVGAINYIGVVPEQRGKGLVNDLLIKGMQVLSDAGARQVVGSIDVLNYPMLAAVENAGFKRQVSTRIYRLDLPVENSG